mgnify:CR=1 FL=1
MSVAAFAGREHGQARPVRLWFEDEARVGAGTTLVSGVWLGKGARVGADGMLFPGVVGGICLLLAMIAPWKVRMTLTFLFGVVTLMGAAPSGYVAGEISRDQNIGGKSNPCGGGDETGVEGDIRTFRCGEETSGMSRTARTRRSQASLARTERGGVGLGNVVGLGGAAVSVSGSTSPARTARPARPSASPLATRRRASPPRRARRAAPRPRRGARLVDADVGARRAGRRPRPARHVERPGRVRPEGPRTGAAVRRELRAPHRPGAGLRVWRTC